MTEQNRTALNLFNVKTNVVNCILLTERKKYCNVIKCYDFMEYAMIVDLVHSTLSNETKIFSSFEVLMHTY